MQLEFTGRVEPMRRMSAVAGLTGVLLLAPNAVRSQAPAKLEFEVASIKPSATVGSFTIDFPPGGRFSARNLTVAILLRTAYLVQDYQILGGPNWMNSAGFDIEARASAGTGEPPRDQVLKMIQALLAERFHLGLHGETRQLPVYNLVVGKTGSKLKPAESNAAPARTLKMGELSTQKMSMATLANLLAFDLKRPVKDETGLHGEFAFTLEWTLGLGESDTGQLSRPSLFTAVQEQLGLKLEAAKGPVEILVIDHLEKPSED